MIKIMNEDLIDKMEDRIDKYLKPIISDTRYELEYDFSRQGFQMYIYKGISPQTIISRMQKSRMSQMFDINMDRSNPRTIFIKLRR